MTILCIKENKTAGICAIDVRAQPWIEYENAGTLIACEDFEHPFGRGMVSATVTEALNACREKEPWYQNDNGKHKQDSWSCQG